MYGFHGRLAESVHLLIPQLENSIRYLLQQSGVITSGFDSDGIQDDHDLNRTLYIKDLVKILGEDRVFALKGLLVERCGSNFRNRFAHGLLGVHDVFALPGFLYVWWLTLHLCCIFTGYGSPSAAQESGK